MSHELKWAAGFTPARVRGLALPLPTVLAHSSAIGEHDLKGIAMRNVIRRALHPRRAGAALLAVGALTGAGLVSPAQANAAAHIRVHFISLYCETTEDSTGPDEPYLLYNGQRMWGNGSLNDRQSVDLNLDRDATGRAYVRLYDADTGIFDSDDFLGEVEINDTEIGMGTTKKFFTEDGAKYTLYYEVLAD